MYVPLCMLFIILLSQMVNAQVQAASRRFNITAPVADSPYVAGQIVPITYTLPDDASLPNVLGLKVYFTSRDASVPFFQATITEDADLSQGFSFKRTANTLVYYEHQLNYGIPKETKAGNYQIVFVDVKGGGNTTVPFIVRPYSASAAASATATSSKPGQASNIFLQGESAASTLSPPLLVVFALVLLSLL